MDEVDDVDDYDEAEVYRILMMVSVSTLINTVIVLHCTHFYRMMMIIWVRRRRRV